LSINILLNYLFEILESSGGGGKGKQKSGSQQTISSNHRVKIINFC
jgi:hypothetical protein